MVKITILYPNKPGSRFDVEYYLNTHMPMSGRLLGAAVKAITVDIGRPGPGGRAGAVRGDLWIHV